MSGVSSKVPKNGVALLARVSVPVGHLDEVAAFCRVVWYKKLPRTSLRSTVVGEGGKSLSVRLPVIVVGWPFSSKSVSSKSLRMMT